MSLADKLQRIAAQRAVKARVGILEDKTYPDGPAVAQVGYWNEYGYEGIVVPERTGTVYHSVNEKTGELNAGGKFVKKGLPIFRLIKYKMLPITRITERTIKINDNSR